MNIALLTTEYAHEKTPVFGGIGTFMTVLAKELKERGHNVIVVVIGGKKNFFMDDNGVPVHVRKYFFRKKRISELIRSVSKDNEKLYPFYRKVFHKEREYVAKEFYKVIKDKDIDIIETHDYGGISYCLNDTIPIVIRCHGTNEVLTREFNYYSKELFHKVHRELEANVISNKKNNIVVVSKYAGRLIKKYFNREDLTVIYNGVNLDKFKPAKVDTTIPKSIYYFGTLSEKKGTKFLCELFNELNSRDKEVTLHLMGGGEHYFTYLKEKVISPEALKNVTYYGKINHSDLNKKLNTASVIVFPTEGENFPFVFLEAMSLEKVVIANAIEPAYEIIVSNENGFIANGKKEFLKLIEKVIDSKFKGEEIKKNARKTVAEGFTSEKMVNDTIDYYNKVIKSFNNG